MNFHRQEEAEPLPLSPSSSLYSSLLFRMVITMFEEFWAEHHQNQVKKSLKEALHQVLMIIKMDFSGLFIDFGKKKSNLKCPVFSFVSLIDSGIVHHH